VQLLPLARIKKMMKDVQDVKIVAADASWAVARAAVSAHSLLWLTLTVKETLPKAHYHSKIARKCLACHWQRGHA
jgi:hypothetical protein